MAFVRFKVNKYTDPLDRAIAELPQVRKGMEEAAKVAENSAKNYVETRPSLQSGKPGRATGTNMADDITHTITTPGSNRFLLRIGWLKNYEKWYSYQDQGFHHYPDFGFIEGAHALKDAEENAVDLIEEVVDKHRKKIKAIATGKSR